VTHTVIGFAGHRHLADTEEVRARIAAALDALSAAHTPLVAVSSIALGADTLFVEEAVRRDIPVLLVLPFPPSRFRTDFSPADWAVAESLLARATHVDVIDATGADEAPAGGEPGDDERYMECGVRVVDTADIMLAAWDGRPGSGPGGTSDVVAYARALERPLVWIDTGGSGEVHERLDQYAPLTRPAAHLPPRAAVERAFAELDASASREAPTSRHLIQRIVVLHLLASVAGLTILALHLEGRIAWAVGGGEILVLVTAFVLSARSHGSHAEWLRSRTEAEICRSFLATWPMRNYTRTLAVPGHERLVRHLRVLQRLDRTPLPSLESALNHYLEHRVRPACGSPG
jgi:hypothetical protein